ncbi:hypothetical protein AB0F91_28565 [Amycolatopsis sp. NPDC023774]
MAHVANKGYVVSEVFEERMVELIDESTCEIYGMRVAGPAARKAADGQP